MCTINNLVTFLEKIFVKDPVFTAAVIFMTNCDIIAKKIVIKFFSVLQSLYFLYRL